MVLFGLSLAQLVLLFALASTLTIALYLLKQRRQRLPVGFIQLWESLLSDRTASRLFIRLRHLFSLLIALCVVAALSLALADPRPRSAAAAAQHVVLLLDAGLTMQATDVRPSRFAEALRRARALAREAGPGRQMLVAKMDAGALPLAAMSDDPHPLEQALERLEPGDLRTDYQRAYRFALDVLRGQSRPELIVLSDAAEDPSPELARALSRAGVAVRHVAIGARGEDVGIRAFALRRYPLDRNRSELLLELYNAGKRAREVELTLFGDGVAIDAQRLNLAAGQSVRRIYDDVTGVSQRLEARLKPLDGADDLAANDRAYAVVPDKRRVRVLCVSDGNRYLEAALLLDEYLDVDLVRPADYAGAGKHDVVIFDRFVPGTLPGKPAIYLEPAAESPARPLQVLGRVQRPFFERVQREHPALRFVALHDVNVASALLVRPSAGDEVLAADPGAPLIVSGRRAGQPFLALTFDLRQSDLPLRPAWPLLLLNTIDWFTAEAPEYVPGSSVGRPAALRLPDGVLRAKLEDPAGGTRELALEHGKLTFVPSRAGFYRVGWPGGERLLAVNLDPDMRRDLTPRHDLRVAGKAASAPATAAARMRWPPWAFLLLFALALLTAEWISYHRRLTV